MKEEWSEKCCKKYSLEDGCAIYGWCLAIKFNGDIGNYKFKKIPCYVPPD